MVSTRIKKIKMLKNMANVSLGLKEQLGISSEKCNQGFTKLRMT